MFHIRREGEECRYGFNFYAWSDRKWSVGFILRLPYWRWCVRWARHVGRFHFKCEWAKPIEVERAELQAWLNR